MEATVIYPFKDKDNNQKHYKKGDTFEGNQERVAFLVGKGFLQVENSPTSTEEDENEKVKEPDTKGPVHVGGGNYELPDGTRVKGKEKAQEAFEALGDE
ncbi:hypothetical protein ACTHQ4_02330 [Alkalicoccobacillus gibsonii]|uniref:hypothetical protein n=1 Tax=Alkalicoccobacillus gibsonii TaxID=79881 RepID=UPI003F7BEFD0